MLRNPTGSWWRRISAELVPAYIQEPAQPARRCPDCSAAYDARDRYCPGCKNATPEWRYG